jgi:hypothetical protein
MSGMSGRDGGVGRESGTEEAAELAGTGVSAADGTSLVLPKRARGKTLGVSRPTPAAPAKPARQRTDPGARFSAFRQAAKGSSNAPSQDEVP